MAAISLISIVQKNFKLLTPPKFGSPVSKEMQCYRKTTDANFLFSKFSIGSFFPITHSRFHFKIYVWLHLKHLCVDIYASLVYHTSHLCVVLHFLIFVHILEWHKYLYSALDGEGDIKTYVMPRHEYLCHFLCPGLNALMFRGGGDTEPNILLVYIVLGTITHAQGTMQEWTQSEVMGTRHKWRVWHQYLYSWAQLIPRVWARHEYLHPGYEFLCQRI